MKLPFETWLESNHISQNAINLFESGIVCYKHSIYPAALIMTYQAFLVLMKERIMSSSIPKKFPSGQWDSIIKKLQNEDEWEGKVVECLRMKGNNKEGVEGKDPVFNINESLRVQIGYWKDRRNDCAHNKSNEINAAHVEMFWSFLRSNLHKLTIEGGAQSLLNKFRDHFDIHQTPEGSDYDYLLRQIRQSVDDADLPHFLIELFGIISNIFDYSPRVKMAYHIYRLMDPVITSNLTDYLKSYEEFGTNQFLFEYLSTYPEDLNRFFKEKKDVRRFWKRELKNYWGAMEIYAHMLRNNLIPEVELGEANDTIVRMRKVTYDAEINDLLKQNGYGESLRQEIFVRKCTSLTYWKHLNAYSNLCVQYLMFFEWDVSLVNIIHKELSKTEWTPYALGSAIRRLFKKRGDLRDRYLLMLNLQEGEMPQYLN